LSRRTTILLDDEIYEKLVSESMKRYKTTRAMSRVANELLRRALKGEAKVLDLIVSEKVASTSARELQTFRRELSKRLES
jgi:predicted CopG family antitoxin